MGDFKKYYRDIRTKMPESPAHFEEVIRRVYELLLAEGDHAIDVGAHIGKHTIPMAKTVGPNGLVVAFEPIPEKYAILLEKIHKENIGNIQLLNGCVGSKNEILKFCYLPDDPGKSSIHLRKKLLGDSREIQYSSICISIDAFLPELKPRFIKIDVEGAEFNVLEGLEKTISRSAPIIHTELGVDTMEVFDVTTSMLWEKSLEIGYKVIDITGKILLNKVDFFSSIEATGVYDYFWVSAENKSIKPLADFIKKQWPDNIVS